MSSGKPTLGAPLIAQPLPTLGHAPAHTESSVPHGCGIRESDENALAGNDSSTAASQPSLANVLPAPQTNRIKLPVLPVPKPDLIQLNDIIPVMQAVIEVASKHVKVSPEAMAQLFENRGFMDSYEVWADAFRRTTECFTELLLNRLPAVLENLPQTKGESEDSRVSSPEVHPGESNSRAVTPIVVKLLGAHNNARVNHGSDCPSNPQPATTRADGIQFRHQSTMTMDLVGATRENSSGLEVENSDNIIINSTKFVSTPADGYRHGEAGKRPSDSAAGSSVKKLKTTMEGE